MPTYKPSPELKKSLAEPIEFELKGRPFKLESIPPRTYMQLADLFESDAPDRIEQFFSLLIGKEAFEELGDIDGREAFPLMRWLSEVMQAGVEPEAKNEETT